ncbi:MAG: transporter, partial [Subtercola sp.]|nr:transporter [Subtercola sp.]
IAVRLPKRLDALLSQIDNGTLAVTSPPLERRVARLERTARRAISALLFGALLIAGAVLHANDAVFGTVLMVASIIPLLHTLLAGRRGR